MRVKTEIKKLTRTIGFVVWDSKADPKKVFISPPESVPLGAILSEPLIVRDGPISVDKEPRKFVENLFQQYRSAYLFALPPTYEDMVGEDGELEAL